MNPYAKMKAPTGGFDLRTIDDGDSRRQRAQRPRQGGAVRVGAGRARSRSCSAAGRAWSSVGRSNYEHREPRRRARSRPRSRACRRRWRRSAPSSPTASSGWRRTRRTRWRYDPQLIANLEKIKLDPRPNTATIFRVDYFRLPDADVDKLFNYYYDSIALYGEVERHIKKSQGRRGVAEGVRREGRRGAHDEELRRRVRQQRRQAHRRQPRRDRRSGLQGRRQGLRRRRHDRLQGPLEHGRAVGRSQVGRKLDTGNVIPMKPTPFMDAVMTGSPDQVRQESYKQRVANIRALSSRIDDEPERAVRGHRRRTPPAPTSGRSSKPLGGQSPPSQPGAPSAFLPRRALPASSTRPAPASTLAAGRAPRPASATPAPRGRPSAASATARRPRCTTADASCRLVALLRATPQTVSHSVAPFFQIRTSGASGSVSIEGSPIDPDPDPSKSATEG